MTQSRTPGRVSSRSAFQLLWPQRFGFNNLARALDGQVDEMALAAARSELFNRMLASQIRAVLGSKRYRRALPS